MNILSLPHIPGGITTRSQVSAKPGSFYKFTEQTDLRSIGGPSPKPYMKEPSKVNPNPYQPSQVKVVGVSTVTHNPVVRLPDGRVAGLYGIPSDSPYANKERSTYLFSADSVQPLVRYSSNATTISELRARVFQVPAIKDTPVIGSPETPSAIGKTPVTQALTPDQLKAQAPVKSNNVPACEEPLDYPVGTLQCPKGFVPLLNTAGREVGCIQTPDFDEVSGFVSQGLTPATVYKPYTKKPLNQEWYQNTCPVGTVEVRRVGNVVLCEGVLLPESNIIL